MDPNATLRALDEAIDERNRDESGFLVKELSRWIASGGFEPEWWRYPRAAAYYAARVPGRPITSL